MSQCFEFHHHAKGVNHALFAHEEGGHTKYLIETTFFVAGKPETSSPRKSLDPGWGGNKRNTGTRGTLEHRIQAGYRNTIADETAEQVEGPADYK